MQAKLIFIFACLITCTYEKCLCSFEKSSSSYGCRLLNQNLLEKNDMDEITGTHWTGYNDLNVTALWSTGSVVKVFPTAFSLKFPQLSYIYLSNTGFEAFTDPFENCKNIDWIVINRNLIAQVPNGMFIDCEKLRILSLFGNKITRVDEDAFDGLSRLNFLYLDSNEIIKLNHNIFEPLVNLEEIDLSNNKIAELNNGVLWPLTEIVTLNLKNNKMTSISENWFIKNTKLASLSLAGNEIFFLGSHPSNIFANLKNLKILNLSENKIENFPFFNGLESIQSINVNSNMLTNVDPITFSYQTLSSLSMNRNNINLAEGFLKETVNLRILELGFNNISLLSENTFCGLENLQSLSLSNNYLSKISADSFQGLHSLSKLILSHNKIKQIDRKFLQSMPKLTWIDMRENECATQEIKLNSTMNDKIEDYLVGCFSSGNQKEAGSIAPFILLLFIVQRTLAK